jgi:hypothetical protein
MGSSIRSKDIVGDFCRHCWSALTDANWFASYKQKDIKTCIGCSNIDTRVILPPPNGILKAPTCSQCAVIITTDNISPSRQKAGRSICKVCAVKSSITSKQKLKQDIIAHYGNKCVCCSEDKLKFLTIDHINQNGAEHRKTLDINIYNWLKQNNYPKDNFRVLCWNCNFSFGHFGYCPHNENTIRTITKPIAIKLYISNHNKHNEIRDCRFCGNELTTKNWSSSDIKNYNNRCTDCRTMINIYKRYILKKNIMDIYGGQKCVCCGDEHMEFLSLDHIYEDGKQHRKLLDKSDGTNFYEALRRAGYPDKDRLQVLCISCNAAKGICGGCPHEEERQKHQEEAQLIKVSNG